MSNFNPSRIQSARKMVKTFKGVSELSQYAARSFIEIANKSIEERGRFLAALSGGSTPMRLYELLGQQFQNEKAA